MATLPADRTKLNSAIANQQPSIVASAQANRETLVEAYDTIDLLNQKVDGLVAGSVLVPFPPAAMSRQSIINGNFDVWQRGIASTNPAISSFLADRWQIVYASTGVLPTSIIHSKQPLVPGDILGAAFLYRINPNGAGSGFGAGDSYGILQKIENGVRYLCGQGKKITISFWAKSDIPGKRIGVHSVQNYGTGGSPTGQELLTGKIFTLTPTWTRYTLTITTNSLNGKTFGTNFDDVLSVNFNIMFGSDFALTRYGTATSETFGGGGSVDIAQIQVNAGDAALPFQPRSFVEEFLLCLRYFEKSYDVNIAPGLFANDTLFMTTVMAATIPNGNRWFLGAHPRFCVQKRIIPTVALYTVDGTPGQWNIAASKRACVAAPYKNGFWLLNNTGTTVTTTTDEAYGHWTADAEL